MVQFTETGWQIAFDYPAKDVGFDTPNDYVAALSGLLEAIIMANESKLDGAIPYGAIMLMRALLPDEKQIEVALPAWQALAAAETSTLKNSHK